ncbi:unnamed protein product [Linum tenue]|uniref:Uncharacterized protein n=1 Tax=Linum tenue TaxID=586396 RepID=A0AAV0GSY8_9ROSI|nr:unnamed protein product [Linum tenue]
MADVAALFTSMVSTTMTMAITKPFSMGLSLFVFAFRAAFLVINTWAELIAASISLHLRLFRSAVICIIALASLPFRVLTALGRQRMLEEQLAVVQAELENVSWERKVLEDHLRAAIKECKNLDSLLAEAEDESDKLITKLELMERELHTLKVENHRLKTIQREQLRTTLGGNAGEEDERKHIADENAADISEQAGDSDAVGGDEVVLMEQRDMAVSQSVLSAVLSLTVGMIVWEGKDTVMPLVVALYTVVGMSMRNVLKFFSTIRNKPAYDAVALLSFNCFILGTLTYPTLPKVVRILGSLASTHLSRLLEKLS